MILADCPRCGRRELRGASGIHLLETGRGPVFALSCRECGAELSAGSNRLLDAEPLDAVAC